MHGAAEPAARTSDRALAPSSLLQLIWLASPALPVGGFSYSEALEAAVDADLVRTETQARDWLLDQLDLVLARGELALIGAAIDAWRDHDVARIEALNRWMLQTRESSELRLQTEQMGRSLAEWLKLRPATPPASLATLRVLEAAPSFPLAFALAASSTMASAHDIVATYAFGWAEAMSQAAVRAVPLGQSAGQRILGALAEAIPAAVQYALSLDDHERQAFAPRLAILSSLHETQYSRLFRS
jgi:urease accessory protein